MVELGKQGGDDEVGYKYCYFYFICLWSDNILLFIIVFGGFLLLLFLFIIYGICGGGVLFIVDFFFWIRVLGLEWVWG